MQTHKIARPVLHSNPIMEHLRNPCFGVGCWANVKPAPESDPILPAPGHYVHPNQITQCKHPLLEHTASAFGAKAVAPAIEIKALRTMTSGSVYSNPKRQLTACFPEQGLVSIEGLGSVTVHRSE